MNQEYKFGDAIPVQEGKLWSDDPKVYALIVENERLREAVKAEREKVATWMHSRGYATGHGDTVEDMLEEVEWQAAEREREAWHELAGIGLAVKAREET